MKLMLKELQRSDKPLSIQRISDLANLEVMSSPYNQTLVSMLKVETSQLKQIRQQTKQTRYKYNDADSDTSQVYTNHASMKSIERNSSS